MTAFQRNLTAIDPSTRASRTKPGSRFLAVTDLDVLSDISDLWPDMTGLMSVSYCDLTADFVSRLQPQVVVTSLVSRHFDAIDVARVLQDAGYPGEVRLLARRLPRPDIVTKELSVTFPDLDIALLLLPTR